MKTVQTFYITLFCLLISVFVKSQVSHNADSCTFKPYGKPIVTIYSNFSAHNSNNATNYGFEILRAYLGYSHNFSPNFSGRIVLDVSNVENQKPSAMTAFLKIAEIDYTTNSLKLDFGMIGTKMFKLQETIWGKRYLYKSLQDEYNFASSADLGVSVDIKILPKLVLDFSILNGEGYKNIQTDSTVLTGLGLTIEPFDHFYLRVYADRMKKESAQISYVAFAGFRGKNISLGAEYNQQNGHGMVVNKNFTGISLYSTVVLSSKFNVFGRFDAVKSSKLGTSTTGWNTTDGQFYMAGIEYFPTKGIQIAPNIRYANKSVGYAETSFYLNVGLNL